MSGGGALATGQGPFTAWDIFYFCIFDRWLNIFDVVTLIVLFIDGIDRSKPVALCLIFSWIFRNIGGVVWAVVRVATVNNVDSWRYTTGVPSFFWYVGEILLDSYTFQKAYAVSGNNKKLKFVSYLGFVPLVLGKIVMIFFRHIYTFKAPTQLAYFDIANPLDATVILLTSWSDLLCCIVIVYVGAKSFRFKRNSDNFVSNLVKTTELRMIVCTFLSIFASTLILSEQCETDSAYNGRCMFNGAREIAVNVVYSLYYLDYLVTKYHKVMQLEKSGILDAIPTPSPKIDKKPSDIRFQPGYNTPNRYKNPNPEWMHSNSRISNHGRRMSEDLSTIKSPLQIVRNKTSQPEMSIAYGSKISNQTDIVDVPSSFDPKKGIIPLPSVDYSSPNQSVMAGTIGTLGSLQRNGSFNYRL
ncbi:hypothetical protein HK098_005060 [Nowakowskiella sp. JEL0407]|nr:hypothetical protein HK098_005060 [Nowakowskiella sp. JEL0407]